MNSKGGNNSSKKQKKKSSKKRPLLNEEIPRSSLVDWTSKKHCDRFVAMSGMKEHPEELYRYGVPIVGEELTRHWNVCNLRKTLGETKGKVFEKWLVSCKSLDSTMETTSSRKLAEFDMEEEEGAPFQDCVVPSVSFGMKLLQEEGKTVPPEQLSKFKLELEQAVKSMKKSVTKDPSMRSEIVLKVGDEGVTIGKVYIKLKKVYREKLYDLYKTFGERSGEGFDKVLATLLLRYDAMQGGIMEASLPPAVFDVLKQDFGVFMEGFASPFNTHFARYCSLFPDTDCAFGSIGTFFQFRPKDGSFECFPPQIPAILERTVTHIEELLISTSHAVSFVLVICGGARDEQYWKMATDSRFCTHVQTFQPREHALVGGLAHRKKEVLKLSVYPTSLVFMQNEKGAKRYPWTDEKGKRLQSAFSGLPSEPAKAEESEPVQEVAKPPVSSNWKQLKKKLKVTKDEKKK